MQTSFKKSVKGATMEGLFDRCETLSVRYYNAVKLTGQYDPEKKYLFDITVRHADGTNARDLFNKEVVGFENKSTQLTKIK